MKPAKRESEKASAMKRSAWMLAIVAALVYVGYIAWNIMRSAG